MHDLIIGLFLNRFEFGRAVYTLEYQLNWYMTQNHKSTRLGGES